MANVIDERNRVTVVMREDETSAPYINASHLEVREYFELISVNVASNVFKINAIISKIYGNFRRTILAMI